jgi:hypothetical protein
VRDESGKVSQVKVGSLTGMFISAHLLFWHTESILAHADALSILLLALIAPNLFAKFLGRKWGGIGSESSSSSSTETSTTTREVKP